MCLLAAGCSGGLPHGRVDPFAAQFVAGGAVDITSGQLIRDALQVARGIDALVHDSQTFVAPDDSMREEMGLYFGEGDQSTAGTGSCDPSGCTFDHLGGSIDGAGSWQTSGSLTTSGNVLALDLTHGFDGPNGTMDWAIDGTLSSHDNRIGGHVHSHGVTHASQFALDGVTWDIVVDFGPAVVDATGCAIGGSIRATTSYDDATNQPGGWQPSFDVQGDFVYSPPCSLSNLP